MLASDTLRTDRKAHEILVSASQAALVRLALDNPHHPLVDAALSGGRFTGRPLQDPAPPRAPQMGSPGQNSGLNKSRTGNLNGSPTGNLPGPTQPQMG